LSLLTFLRESTWGYPVIAAIHVLAMSWFVGTVLVSQFASDLRSLRHLGIALVLLSGAVLFSLHPSQYSHSLSFGVKMLLLVLILGTKPTSSVSLVLWVAVIFASRAIAFW
jgi:hypothetical protein